MRSAPAILPLAGFSLHWSDSAIALNWYSQPEQRRKEGNSPLIQRAHSLLSPSTLIPLHLECVLQLPFPSCLGPPQTLAAPAAGVSSFLIYIAPVLVAFSDYAFMWPEPVIMNHEQRVANYLSIWENAGCFWENFPDAKRSLPSSA